MTELNTKTQSLFLYTYLNKLQTKVKQRFRNLKHCERIEKNKRKIHRTLKKHGKLKLISTNRKKT